MSKLSQFVKNAVPFGKRDKFKYMSLKEFIYTYKDDLNEYFEWGLEDLNLIEDSDIFILCIVDTGYNRYTLPGSYMKPRIAGKKRRNKIKHRYSYDNPLNRIHGYMILEDINTNLIPKDKNLLSLTLICSSSFSDKKGIGSDMMELLKILSKEAGYTDIVLEVANEYSAMGIEEDEEEKCPEEDREWFDE